MYYDVRVSDDVLQSLNSLDAKSRNICIKNVKKLVNPYPGRGLGDKESIVVDGEEVYRLHIGRTHTAFYIVDEESKTVSI